MPVIDFRQGLGDAYRAKREGLSASNSMRGAVSSLGGRTPGISSQYQEYAQRMRTPNQYGQMALNALPNPRGEMRMAAADAMSRYKPMQAAAEREAARRGLGGLTKDQLTKLAIAGASGAAGAATQAATRARNARFAGLQSLAGQQTQREQMERGAYDRAALLARHGDDMARVRANLYDRMGTEAGEFYEDRGGDQFENDPYGGTFTPRRQTAFGPESLSGANVGAPPRQTAIQSQQTQPATSPPTVSTPVQQTAVPTGQTEPPIRVSDIHRGEGGRIGGIGSLSRAGIGDNEYIDASGMIIRRGKPKLSPEAQRWQEASAILGEFLNSDEDIDNFLN